MCTNEQDRSVVEPATVVRVLLAIILVAAIMVPGGVSAQDGAWRVSVGGGLAAPLNRGDDAASGPVAGVARAGIERVADVGPGLAFEWVGIWLTGDLGPESRQHVGITGSVVVGHNRVRTRIGLGIGTATVTEVDGPPPNGLPGDIDVGVGARAALDGVGGVELSTRIGAFLTIVSAAEMLVQRAGGYTFVTGIVTARVRLGGRNP